MTKALRLIVTAGARAGTPIDVDDVLVLGRGSGGEGDFDDEKMSRRHAFVRRDVRGGWVVEDAGSRNGTYVNGARIGGRRALEAGDTIRLGETMLRVADDAGALPPLPPPSLHPPVVPSPPRRDDVAAAGARPAPLVASPAALVRSGRRIPVPAAGLTVGRTSDNDVVVESDRVSRNHARIVCSRGRYFLADLGSMNGSELNGERLVKEARWLHAGDTITIGPEQFRFLVGGEETRFGGVSAVRDGVRRIRFDRPTLSIGRDAANDLQLDSPSVSRFHAEVVHTGGRVQLRDLGSRNGTRLDGRPVTSAAITTGSEIGIGPFRLVFDGNGFVERDDRGALHLDGAGVAVVAGRKTLLEPTSVSVKPGELIVVIGESGSGKTTLIKALAGVRRPTAGTVLVGGDPVWTRTAEIGYLPQDEIVHPRLTVLESLRYSARLRLPADQADTDIDAAVARAVNEVSLDEHVHTRIGSLSGGQRKRVGLATELLTRPALLFLDEPTTGLDPSLETRMMQLFRSLAAVGQSALVVATHATRNLDLADKLWVVGRGGVLCFAGSPVAAKTFFGVGDYEGIYAALEREPAPVWRKRFQSADPGRHGAAPAPSAKRPLRATGRGVLSTQTRVLLSRYLKTFVRDRRNVAILLLQVPVLAVGMALLFSKHVFGSPGRAGASSTSQLLFVLVTATIWLGTLDSAREVIKERAILARERAVGLDLRAYLASKTALLFGLVCIQTLLLALVVLALRPMDEPIGSKLLLLALLVTTGFTAVTMGLVISSVVRSEDQATAVIPIAMIVQLLFAGAIVTVKNMGAVVAGFSTLIFERTAYAGAGSAIDMNGRIRADAGFRVHNPYGYSFFDLPGGAALAILGAFVAAMLLATAAILHRNEVG